MPRSKDSDHQPHRLRDSATDVIALWRLDESSAASNASDAQTTAPITLVQHGSPGVAQSVLQNLSGSGARSFDGATQWFAQAAAGGIEAKFASDWTVKAWLRPIDNGVQMGVVQYGDAFAGSNTNMSIELNTSLGIRVFWEHTAGTDVIVDSNNSVWQDSEEMHVAVVKDADPDAFDKVRVRIYKNGVLVGKASGLTNTNGGSNCRFIVGGSFDAGSIAAPGNLFFGDIDDVTVLPYAATEHSIRDDYARGIRDFDEDALYQSQFVTNFYRVLIEDRFGGIDGNTASDLVDMSNLFGWCWVRDASIDEGVDSQGDTATVSLTTRIGDMSLSTLAKRYAVGATVFYENPLESNAGSNSYHFLQPMSRIVIEVATVPWGTSLAGAEPFFDCRFDGFIKNISNADDVTHIDCIDKIAALQDVWIEPDKDGQDRKYGNAGGISVESQLQQIIDDNDPSVYSILTIDNSGAGSALEVDVFSTSVGVGQGKPHLVEVGDAYKITGTVNFNASGTIASLTSTRLTTTETVVGAFAAETVGTLQLLPRKSYRGGKPSIWVPTSPAWNVYEWATPSTTNVGAHLDEVMQQIGWSCRFIWDDIRQEYRLTIFRPEASSPGASVPRARLLSTGKQDTDALWARNVIVTEFEDITNQDAVGDIERAVRVATKPSSALVYGRRYSRIGVGSTSQINTAAEAQALSDNVLDDLDVSEPVTSYDVLFDGVTEKGDTFDVVGEMGVSGAAPSWFQPPMLRPVTKTFGLTGKKTELKTTGVRTTLEGKGTKAPAKVRNFGDLFQGNGWMKGRGTLGPQFADAPILASLNGQLHVRWQRPPNFGLNKKYVETEVHVGLTSTFTPSASTLLGVSSTSEFHLVRADNTTKELDDGETYYVRLVHRDSMRNRGPVTSAVSAITARPPALDSAGRIWAPQGLITGAAFTLVADTAYFVYLGKTVREISIAKVRMQVTGAGVGAGASEAAVYSSSSAPSRTSPLTLTKLAYATTDVVTSTGVKASGALATTVNPGVHLWAAWRTNLATTQPTVIGVANDFGDGHVMAVAASGSLNAVSMSASIPAVTTATIAPFLKLETS